ncbi:MAG: hypothetical protein VW270_21445 [Candidatus Poseidoniales archaeon]
MICKECGAEWSIFANVVAYTRVEAGGHINEKDLEFVEITDYWCGECDAEGSYDDLCGGMYS